MTYAIATFDNLAAEIVSAPVSFTAPAIRELSDFEISFVGGGVDTELQAIGGILMATGAVFMGVGFTPLGATPLGAGVALAGAAMFGVGAAGFYLGS